MLVFLGFDKNIIYSYVLFHLKYESTNGSLTFYKDRMPGKNLILELWSQNL